MLEDNPLLMSTFNLFILEMIKLYVGSFQLFIPKDVRV